MIEIKNLGQVIRQIEVWEVAVNKLVEDVARGLTIKLFKTAVEFSPQYSGDFAANWRYSLNAPDTSFDGQLFTVLGTDNQVRRRQGDRQAISYAHAVNSGRASPFKLGDTVYISNSAEHGESYAEKVWKDSIRRRQANPFWIKERVQDLFASYSVINGNQARALSKETL